LTLPGAAAKVSAMHLLVAPELRWLVDGLMVALALGLVLALATALLLLWRPHALLMLNERLSRWVDTEAPFRALERPRQWERFFYRHHRVLGGLVTAGATYVLGVWALVYDRAAAIALLDRRWLADGMDWVVPAVETILVVLHVAILAVGLIVLFRPSLLKNVERVANRWHRAPVDALDRVVYPLDRGFAVYPRLSGLLLLLAAGWSLVMLAPFFRQALAG
jgi:hypothetical protein